MFEKKMSKNLLDLPNKNKLQIDVRKKVRKNGLACVICRF